MQNLTRIGNYYKRNVASVFFRKPFVVRAERPVISFTFDDFPESALTVGGTILREHGVCGTYYASLGLVGTTEPSGRIFVENDLARLFEQQHELGCHTFSHRHSWDTAPRVFEEAILQNRQALRKLVPDAEFTSFSYPISAPRPLTKARTARHFLSCRGGGQTFNVGTTDLNQLSAFFLEKNRDRIEVVQRMIDANHRSQGWLIFATHDIDDDPTPYGCTPRFFADVVRYAVQSGARILPVAGALAALGAH